MQFLWKISGAFILNWKCRDAGTFKFSSIGDKYLRYIIPLQSQFHGILCISFLSEAE